MAEIEVFRALLETANNRTNLVGLSTLGDFWRRHVVDSAQLLDLAPSARTWADLGSGAGLPGVILAILLKGRPGAMVYLIESRARRCAFLREVAAVLALPVEVIAARAETLRLTVEVVTARACAPLDRLLAYARPYVERGARGLFLKGETVEMEMVAARRRWRFDATLHPSLSDPRGRVLSVTGLADV
ncbi:MAG: 16S rRNA (guanine(527)-N(7))-methyltransferase RsmG [Caulobacteraceae bacterium]